MPQAVDTALKPLPCWQDLQQTADGTLFFEPAGVHFVRVEKTGNKIHPLRQVFPHLALCAFPQGNQVVFARLVPIPDQEVDLRLPRWLQKHLVPVVGPALPFMSCHCP